MFSSSVYSTNPNINHFRILSTFNVQLNTVMTMLIEKKKLKYKVHLHTLL